MIKRTKPTRKELVLELLTRRFEYHTRGGWVLGSTIASKEWGGSEGLRRLRELRADGHHIERRKAAVPHQDQYEYRYISPHTRAEPVAPTPTLFGNNSNR